MFLVINQLFKENRCIFFVLFFQQISTDVKIGRFWQKMQGFIAVFYIFLHKIFYSIRK